jgi:hypothetical protein
MHICQNCGAIVRRLGFPCPSCGNVVTKHSHTGVLQPLAETPPNTVCGPADPLLSEKMSCKLHHAVSTAANRAVEADGRLVAVVSEPLACEASAGGEAEVGSALAVMVAEPRARILAGDFFAEVCAPVQKSAAALTAQMETPPVVPLPAVDGGRPPGLLEAADISITEGGVVEESERTQELMQRLVESNMSSTLPAESSFFDGVLTKAGRQQKGEAFAASRAGQAADQDEVPTRKPDSLRFSPSAKVVIPVLVVLTAIVLVFLFSGFSKRQADTPAGSAGSPQSTAWVVDVAPRSLSGVYSYRYSDNGQKIGSFNLVQDGSKISGNGSDFSRVLVNGVVQTRVSVKPFQITGTYAPPDLNLVKSYSSGTAVVYEGKAARGADGKVQLKGCWRLMSTARDGASEGTGGVLRRNRQLASRAGEWQASWTGRAGLSRTKWPVLTGATDLQPGSASNRAGEHKTQASSDNLLASLFWPESEPYSARFLRILAGCILFGLVIVKISLKFFGMHGLINIWEREKYIPCALRASHLKLMHELGRGGRGGLLLGQRLEWSLYEFYRPRRLYLPDAFRRKNPHVLAMGAGAKGKTRLLAGMIVNEIKNNDRSLVVVDSEGSLVELVLRFLGTSPDGRKLLERVNIIDPCNDNCRLCFNPLMVNNADALQAQASAIVMGFKSVYTESHNQQNQWTQQTANILRNAVLLLMLNDRTLEDLPVLLADNDFRDVLLEKVEKELSGKWKTLFDAWSNYKRLARTEQWLNWIEPILNRVQPLLSDQRIARLLTDKNNSLDLSEVLAKKKILLVRVPEGQLEKGGNLLGSLIVTGIRQAGLANFEKTQEASFPCSLYLDEMNNFLDAEAFEAICSDLRKVQIGIHATLKSLQDLSEEFRNRVLLNFGTMALFSISKKDADILGPTMFRVDGRKIKKVTPRDIFNPVNATPNMDFASDEEKVNINRLVGQDERTYFCHLLGTEAGVFRLKAPEFKDIARADVNWDLIENHFEKQSDSQDDHDAWQQQD